VNISPEHVELFAGNKILYKMCHLIGIFLKIHIVYYSPDINGMIKLMGVRWEGYVARMGNERNT
jgi:hypothetical protein